MAMGLVVVLTCLLRSVSCCIYGTPAFQKGGAVGRQEGLPWGCLLGKELGVEASVMS